MNERIRYLIKNTGILTISNFASKIMVFLLVPIYTRVLTTAEYGTYDLVTSTVQLLLPVLTLNIIDAVMRFSMDRASSNEEIVVIGVRYVFRSFVPVVIFLALCAYKNIFHRINGLEWLIAAYFVFYSINQFFIQLAKGLEKILDMGIAGILSTAVLLGGTLYFLFVLSSGLRGFFIANVAAQAISCLYFSVRLKIWKRFKFTKINRQTQKEMLIYCLPLIFTTLSWWVNNMSDRYAVTFICGAAANGILSVAYKIPSILNIIQQIFVQAWQISAIKEYGKKDADEFYGKTFVLLNFMMCVFCSILILCSKFLARLLYANDFFQAWKYVPFLLIACVLNSASGFIGPILLAAKDTKSMAKSAIYGAIVNLVLNIILVYSFGIQGATVATAISSYIIYAVRKHSAKGKIIIKKYWKLILTWALLCAQAVIGIYSHSYFIQALLLITILAVNMENITIVLKSIKKIVKR